MSTTTKMPGGLTAASAAKQAGDKLQTVLGGADTTAATGTPIHLPSSLP